MTNLDAIVGFFKKMEVTATVNPEITVKYEYWSQTESVASALKAEWAKLRSSISSSAIKKAEWNRYRAGFKQEELIVELDGVVMKLTGPYEKDPDYKEPGPREDRPQTPQEIADEVLAQALSANYYRNGVGLAWAAQHGSRNHVQALISFLQKSLDPNGVDEATVAATTSRVLQVLNIRALVVEETKKA